LTDKPPKAIASGSLHEDLRRDEIVAPPSEKSFGITFAAVALLLAADFWWRHNWKAAAVIALIASAGFLSAGFLAPRILRPLNLVWLRFGLLLHKVVNPIIMGLLFFCVITPMGVVMRAAGKDFLRLAKKPGDQTYWLAREALDPKLNSMKNQY
jgi:hypothetical protein